MKHLHEVCTTANPLGQNFRASSRKRNNPPVHARRVFISLDQPYYPAPLYSIERMNDVVPIEHS
jgi:hypothetical protein